MPRQSPGFLGTYFETTELNNLFVKLFTSQLFFLSPHSYLSKNLKNQKSNQLQLEEAMLQGNKSFIEREQILH